MLKDDLSYKQVKKVKYYTNNANELYSIFQKPVPNYVIVDTFAGIGLIWIALVLWLNSLKKS